MERRRAPPAPRSGPWLLGLLLLPWTLQRAANKSVSFSCKISYPPELRNVTAWYFHVDLQSQRSPEKQINCSPSQVRENQMHSLKCRVSPRLPDASATGTYYCSAHWPKLIRISNGVFILVRDTGYRQPPQGSQKLLLLCFMGLLTALSILVTGLLFWKKRQMRAPRKGLDPGTAHSKEQPQAESIYTTLQGRDTEIYSCIQNVPSSLPPAQSLVSQEKMHGFTDDSNFNLVYENL
ncbi:NFAT activation molecule 1 [Suricata suricatta]|uniref:NFAM1 Ig-like domain-containing protein n=1 Tax=Suricata suricatta TaxID=37032 RepID=A0A673UY19_SURSU|nr:NFAT activation molecule 1 [Suricata suricatta]